MLKARVSQGVPKSTPFLVSPAMAGSILAGRANYNAHAFCHGIDGNRTNQVIRSQSQGLSDEDIRNLATFKASQAHSIAQRAKKIAALRSSTTTVVLTAEPMH